MKLKDKVAVVTGASTGIGQAIAVELAKQGASVFITARRKKELDQTKKLIEQQRGQAEIIIADLSKIDSVNNLIQSIKNRTKKIDILVNVAGIWHSQNQIYADKNFDTFSQQVILDTITVGTTAPTLLTHAFIPLMPKNSKILNISGTFEDGAKGWLPYYVSKKAIEDLTVGLSEELKDKDIQVNCISPSDTATKPYKKFFPEYASDGLAPEKIAKQAVQLCLSKTTGKVIVMKKGKKPFESFHF